jgi:predicted nucleotidyltransferase component of viral defense system
LNPPPRYSEDIDLVQIKDEPIGKILDKINEVVDFLPKRKLKQKANNNTIIYQFTSEHDDIPQKIKIEINCREHFNVLELNKTEYMVDSSWFTGKTHITTYQLNELLGTKLRALYQQKKGRGVFDLYYASQNSNIDYHQILQCYYVYMAKSVWKLPTRKMFLDNIEKKEYDPTFIGDMEGLLRKELRYNQVKAFDWLKNDIVSKM